MLWNLLFIHLLFCFYPWPYIIKIVVRGINSYYALSSAVHVYYNLFWKICFPLSNLNHVVEVFQGLLFFLPSSYRKKICEKKLLSFEALPKTEYVVSLSSVQFTLKLKKCNFQELEEQSKFSDWKIGFSVEWSQNLVFKFEKLSFSREILISH